jgi:hypothetical protein
LLIGPKLLPSTLKGLLTAFATAAPLGIVENAIAVITFLGKSL